jgi:photosystem II stability/assembly factor-like uncharacterized protein
MQRVRLGTHKPSILISTMLLLIGLSAGAFAQSIAPELYGPLKYRHIGPPGNRLAAVAGIVGDPNIIYAGAASGGIWKTTDGGTHWTPIFDDKEVSSVSALAVAASDPNVVWAGTGETFIRSNISIGNGIYKSTDAGKTWQHMGLEATGRIARVLIDPRNPDVVFAASMGHSYGPQQERGVYRTTDGGVTWERVLFVDEETGASDIVMDPNNPRIIFAGMWRLQIRTWGRNSGSTTGGVFRSKDGGTTWKRLEDGLPTTATGKVGLAIAPSNSNRVYALIETSDGEPREGRETQSGVLWSSDNGGDRWKLISHDHELTQRPHYYTRLAVAPDNQNEIYTLAPRASISIDGGVTAKRFSISGGDHHDMWIDPTNPSRMIVGNDQYVAISVNRGESWRGIRLPIAQMYHVAVDNEIPYNVYGNRQDGPSTYGPSNSLYASFGGGGIGSSEWKHVGACECGFAYPDPEDSNIVWSGCFAAGFTRFERNTGHARSVDVWPESYMGWPAGEVKYRIQWTFPIHISPHDHNKIYTGSQHVHQTTDGGESWEVISPDLSTGNPELLRNSGGLVRDNLGVEYAAVVFAIAESPLEEGLIWVGTNDGLVQLTRDGGTNWTNVTDNIPDLPEFGTVSNVEPSRYNAGTAYISVDFHQVNIREPYIYKTDDYGESWTRIVNGIPETVFSYVHVVREDPSRQGMLYAGTENGVYVSWNDGENWQALQTNLPHAPVHWLVVQDHFNDLVIGTYGRGFWILDDITPLQGLNQEIVDSDVHLFQPRDAYRFLMKGAPMQVHDDPSMGDNPKYGASIHYYLKAKRDSNVKISILNAQGEVVDTVASAKAAGINRVYWDLRHHSSKQAKLRTQPLYAPWVELDSTGYRGISTWGVRGSGLRPLVAPGNYTVRLEVDGQVYTQPLVVLKDPSSTGTMQNIRSQEARSLEIRDNLSEVVDMINEMEWIRKQIHDMNERLKGQDQYETVIAEGKALDSTLINFEQNLFQMRLTGGGQDVFRNPAKLYARFGFLAADVETSWGGVGSDWKPTAQVIEVHDLLKERLRTYQGTFRTLMDENIPAYNRTLSQNNLGGLVTIQPRPSS